MGLLHRQGQVRRYFPLDLEDQLILLGLVDLLHPWLRWDPLGQWHRHFPLVLADQLIPLVLADLLHLLIRLDLLVRLLRQGQWHLLGRLRR